MNKKSNIDDIGVAIYILLGVGFIVLISMGINQQLTDKFVLSNSTNNVSKTFMVDYNNKLYQAFDYGFIFLAVGFIIFSFISARLIPTSSLFYVIALIIVLFIWVLAIISSSLYVKMIESSSYIATISTNFIFIPYVLPNLLYYALIYTFIIGIALYTKEN
jgi:hypothetical protein